MKRSPLGRKTPLRSGGPLRRVAAKVRRWRNTGPSREVRAVVRRRSGGMCEWPGCTHFADDQHHRMGRGAGGSKDPRVNQPSNLLDACRFHHDAVTSVSGEALDRAKRMGWVVLRWQTPAEVPVLTRHDGNPVLLTDSGGWLWQTREGLWAPG